MVTAALAVSLCGQSKDAQKPAPAGEDLLITTPDGSRFLLRPDTVHFAAPVVHWVTLVPTGPEEDPVGAEGLARAIVRASLDGSGDTGSLDADREIEALETLDALERRGISNRRAEQRATEAERSAARAVAASLGIPDAWRRALARAGASDVELREIDGASLIHVALPTDALTDVALLVRERRERPLLRGLREQFEQVRAELLASAATATGKMAREILGLTFPGAADARPILAEPRVVTRAEAVAEFMAIHCPSRGLHVLTGGFDREQVASVLRAVFAQSQIGPTADPPAPVPSESRGQRSVLPGVGDDGVSIAWPMPDADPAMVVAAAEWLAGGHDSHLASALRGAGFGDVQVSYKVDMPARARPGLLVVQVVAARPNPKNPDLESTLATILDHAAERGPAGPEVTRVELRLRVMALSWLRAPRESSFALAELVGLRNRRLDTLDADPPRPSAADLIAVLEKLRAQSQRTLVVAQEGR